MHEVKWSVPLTFCLWQRQNFVIDLGAISEVSRFSSEMKVWTQNEAHFNNPGDTPTFHPTAEHR